ncbi:MAG TPA: hypothetical protein VI300_01890 [Solirubrobacter sp.]
MIRLSALGAALFSLAALALPTFAPPHTNPDVLTHRDTRGQLQEVNLAEVVQNADAQGDSGDSLPTAWCGDETDADDTANAATPATKAQFKVVYAYAADRPDRFAGWANALQANVAVVQRFLSAQDGGTKAIRFDMGTRCGPQYADIQVVQLPGARSSYVDDFGAITGAVSRALGPASGPRNVIILGDSLAGGAQEYGLGETVMGSAGETPGAANVHNRGGLSSVLFSRDGAAAPGNAKWGWWPEGFLHEMTHNLGAVQWGAPHSTQPAGQQSPHYGHCWQGADVMCYTENAGAAHPMVQDCAALPGAIAQSYDCGHDDYFNPAPPAGSYLATHWNTYDSAFLARCGELAPACGGGALWVPAPPAATAAPTVAGGVRRGSQLVAQPGTWSNAPSGYAFQWQRLTDEWDNIDGATADRYTPTDDDLGRRLRVTVVATNDDGSASAGSAPTVPVGASAITRAASRCRQAKVSGKSTAKAPKNLCLAKIAKVAKKRGKAAARTRSTNR